MKSKKIAIFFIISLFLAFLDIFSKNIAFNYFPAIIFSPVYRFSMDRNTIKSAPKDQYNFQELRAGLQKQGIKLSHHAQVHSFGYEEEIWIHDVEKRYLLKEKDQEIQVYSSKEEIPPDFISSSPYLFVPVVYNQPVIPGFFDIKAAFNRGAMWSILQGRVTLLTVFSFIAIGFILYLVIRGSFSLMHNIAFAFITSGAIGNLWDRIVYDGVRDFLDFYVGKYHWPTFNLADSFILIGIGLFLLVEWKTSNKGKEASSPN